MNSNVLFLSFSLLSWGWLSKTWLETTGVLLIIFVAKLTTWRWKITLTQFYRWGDLSSLLIVMLLVYLYLFQTSERAIFVMLKWLPLLFAPILITQLFSSEQKLPLGTLFYSFRKRETVKNQNMDFQLPYAALTLLSAGAANVKNLSYFALAIGLFVGILWTVRPRRTPIGLWLLFLSMAIGLSYLGQLRLRQLQNFVEYQSMEWLEHWIADPFKSQTSIGDLGEMKLSDKIVFRVKAKEPLYLQQASYDFYLGESWTVSRPSFRENLAPIMTHQPLQHLKIVQQFNQREDVLALPDGTVSITGVEGAILQYTELGAVKIIDTPDLGELQVSYTGQRTGTFSHYDLQIPKQQSDWLKQLSAELKLAKLKPQAATVAIRTYFQKNFNYSLYLGTKADADLALRDFVLKRKAGHCEYFAVASVLLLRQAGIPARLANGYVVEEYDSKNNLYIVRRRHAHAWAIAYIQGIWHIVDSTPSQWLEMENENASLWQPLNDWFSNQWLNFKEWRLKQDEQQNSLWLSLALVLFFYISWRIYSARRQLTRAIKIAPIAISPLIYRGLDSEFYLIERQLQNTPEARAKNESMQQWVRRLQKSELNVLYRWHYQLRFDPAGLSFEHRIQLQQQVQRWLVHNCKEE